MDDTPSEKTFRARVVKVLYTEFEREGLSPVDALMAESLLAERVAPEHTDKARRVIHELAIDDQVPIRHRMNGKAVEFAAHDEETLRTFVEAWLKAHDEDELPLE